MNGGVTICGTELWREGTFGTRRRGGGGGSLRLSGEGKVMERQDQVFICIVFQMFVRIFLKKILAKRIH